MTLPETQLEEGLVSKFHDLQYERRADIRDRATPEKNFGEKFESLNRVKLTDAEFGRLLDEIANLDVSAAVYTLRSINAFTRDDGTPLRINTDNSHHRYDAVLLVNGVPAAQIELKSLGVSPRRAMEQIVEYKNESFSSSLLVARKPWL